jgi:hypothetical protein
MDEPAGTCLIVRKTHCQENGVVCCRRGRAVVDRHPLPVLDDLGVGDRALPPPWSLEIATPTFVSASRSEK